MHFGQHSQCPEMAGISPGLVQFGVAHRTVEHIAGRTNKTKSMITLIFCKITRPLYG